MASAFYAEHLRVILSHAWQSTKIAYFFQVQQDKVWWTQRKKTLISITIRSRSSHLPLMKTPKRDVMSHFKKACVLHCLTVSQTRKTWRWCRLWRTLCERCLISSLMAIKSPSRFATLKTLLPNATRIDPRQSNITLTAASDKPGFKSDYPHSLTATRHDRLYGDNCWHAETHTLSKKANSARQSSIAAWRLPSTFLKELSANGQPPRPWWFGRFIKYPLNAFFWSQPKFK